MKSRGQTRLVSLRCLFGVAALALMAAQPASGQSQTGTSADVATVPAEAGGAEAGMIVYVDPNTGAILSEPAPGTLPFQLTPELRNAFSTSSEGLVPVQSPVPGGGVSVNLQGRFQSPMVGMTDDSGRAKAHHVERLPVPLQ